MINWSILLFATLASASNGDAECLATKAFTLSRPDLPIDQGWKTFYFSEIGSVVTYSIPKDGSYEIALTDAFCPGDAFRIHVNDSPDPFLSTNLVENQKDCENRVEDPEKAYNSELFSHGAACAQFKAGDKISVIVRRNQSGCGKAFIRAKSMTEDCQAALPFSAVAPALPTAPINVVQPTGTSQEESKDEEEEEEPVVTVTATEVEEESEATLTTAVIITSSDVAPTTPAPVTSTTKGPLIIGGGFFGPRPSGFSVSIPVRPTKPPQGIQLGRKPQAKQPAKQEAAKVPVKEEVIKKEEAKEEVAAKQPTKPAKQEAAKQPSKPAKQEAVKQPNKPAKQPAKEEAARKETSKPPKFPAPSTKQEHAKPARVRPQKQPVVPRKKQPQTQKQEQEEETKKEQPAKQQTKQPKPQVQKKPGKQVIAKPVV